MDKRFANEFCNGRPEFLLAREDVACIFGDAVGIERDDHIFFERNRVILEREVVDDAKRRAVGGKRHRWFVGTVRDDWRRVPRRCVAHRRFIAIDEADERGDHGSRILLAVNTIHFGKNARGIVDETR